MRPFLCTASFQSGELESSDVSDGVHVVTGVSREVPSAMALLLARRDHAPRNPVHLPVGERRDVGAQLLVTPAGRHASASRWAVASQGRVGTHFGASSALWVNESLGRDNEIPL
jgi:hypothetical protein